MLGFRILGELIKNPFNGTPDKKIKKFSTEIQVAEFYVIGKIRGFWFCKIETRTQNLFDYQSKIKMCFKRILISLTANLPIIIRIKIYQIYCAAKHINGEKKKFNFREKKGKLKRETMVLLYSSHINGDRGVE